MHTVAGDFEITDRLFSLPAQIEAQLFSFFRFAPIEMQLLELGLRQWPKIIVPHSAYLESKLNCQTRTINVVVEIDCSGFDTKA